MTTDFATPARHRTLDSPLLHLDIRHGSVMSNINELKDKIDTKTLNMVLLSVATAGFQACWVWPRRMFCFRCSSGRSLMQ